MRDEDNRPQPRLDRMTGSGMTTVVGRVRPDPLLDIRMVVLSHNTIRGAAGGSLYNAELIARMGYLGRAIHALACLLSAGGLMPAFEDLLDPQNRAIFQSLDSPLAIQAYLDSIPYMGEDLNRTPVRVMQDRQCHCLDGGFLAALALRRLGFAPLLIDLIPEPGADDDHVLAVYQVNGFWGAIAKSNYPGSALPRARPPQPARAGHDLLRGLLQRGARQRTLRGYTRPFNLAQFDRSRWMDDQAGTDRVVERFYARPFIPLITPAQTQALTLLDERSFQANLYGVNLNETFKAH